MFAEDLPGVRHREGVVVGVAQVADSVVEEGGLAHIAGNGHPLNIPPPIAICSKIYTSWSTLWAPAGTSTAWVSTYIYYLCSVHAFTTCT